MVLRMVFENARFVDERVGRYQSRSISASNFMIAAGPEQHDAYESKVTVFDSDIALYSIVGAVHSGSQLTDELKLHQIVRWSRISRIS